MNNTITTQDQNSATAPAPRRTATPRYGVRETTDAFVITVSVPGVERSSVETTLDGENLTVNARRAWTPPADWTSLYREIPVVDYRLVLQLDHRVNREAVRAELSQGVLTLTVPKAEAVKPRRIEIQS
jgi:HSP20 family molecular chaperone IbpA